MEELDLDRRKRLQQQLLPSVAPELVLPATVSPRSPRALKAPVLELQELAPLIGGAGDAAKDAAMPPEVAAAGSPLCLRAAAEAIADISIAAISPLLQCRPCACACAAGGGAIGTTLLFSMSYDPNLM